MGSLQPNLEDLNLRMMSCSVAATTKYSCFSRSSFPSKNYKSQTVRDKPDTSRQFSSFSRKANLTLSLG